MKTLQSFSIILAGLSLLLMSQLANADGWPTSVVGTWSVRANNTVGTMHITFQQSTGQCQQILGDIFGNPLQGFYCPSSGRIHFLRKIASTNDTVQDYSANLSQNAATNFMSGLFASDGGSFGEYNFAATK
jgi:hypothetical protein